MAATNTKRYVQKAWLGGMNTFAAEDSVQNDQAFLLNNITLMNRTQAIAKISGSRKFLKVVKDPLLEDSTFADNLFHFTKINGQSTQIVAFHDPNGWYIAEFTESGFTEILPSGVAYSLPVTDFISFAGKMYFVTGENAVFRWDGVSATYDRVVLPLSFSPTVLEIFNSRAYYAGDAAEPTRVIFSLPNQPEVFNSTLTDFLDVVDSLGDGIISLNVLANNLVVFKKRSIHLIIGSPPREVREVSSVGIGAASKDTIQRTQIGLIFLSELGIYVFNGSSLNKLSLAVEPNIRQTLGTSQNNLSSAYFENVYYIFDQSAISASIDRGLSFALDTASSGSLGITALTNFHCKNSIVLSSFDANNDWLAIRDKSNVIIKMNNAEYPFYYDNEDAQKLPLESNVITHWTDAGNPTVIKQLRTVHLLTQRPLIDLEVIVEVTAYGQLRRTTLLLDGSEASLWGGNLVDNAVWNSFNWEPSNAFHYRLILPSGVDFERVRLQLNSANTGELFNLMAVEYHFVPRREI